MIWFNTSAFVIYSMRHRYRLRQNRDSFSTSFPLPGWWVQLYPSLLRATGVGVYLGRNGCYRGSKPHDHALVSWIVVGQADFQACSGSIGYPMAKRLAESYNVIGFDRRAPIEARGQQDFQFMAKIAMITGSIFGRSRFEHTNWYKPGSR